MKDHDLCKKIIDVSVIMQNWTNSWMMDLTVHFLYSFCKSSNIHMVNIFTVKSYGGICYVLLAHECRLFYTVTAFYADFHNVFHFLTTKKG